MKIPPSKYHVGDEVLVRNEEAGCPPHFQAQVCTVNFDQKTKKHIYTVSEIDKNVDQRTDGYTEDWLTLLPAVTLPPCPQAEDGEINHVVEVCLLDPTTKESFWWPVTSCGDLGHANAIIDINRALNQCPPLRVRDEYPETFGQTLRRVLAANGTSL